jgi:NitT/TauT family transport system ATP-binding protein
MSLDIEIMAKHYPEPTGGERLVLRDVTLRVADDELVCLFGPSGCGKTTLLNIVAGLDNDYQGRVRYSADRPRIGTVFQSPRLLPWLTVEQNLELVLERRDTAHVDALLVATGLRVHARHYPAQLSGGLARRVALARALAIEPDVLLLDEPFASLDAAGADVLRAEVQRALRRRPTTALFVTHDLREAALLADRVVFLSSAPGHIVGEVHLEGPDAARFEDEWLQPTLERLTAHQAAI